MIVVYFINDFFMSRRSTR